MTAPALWTAAEWTMLHLGWVGTAIGLVAAVLRRLLGRSRPEARYGAALACLLALAASPFVLMSATYRPEPDRPAGPAPAVLVSGPDAGPAVVPLGPTLGGPKRLAGAPPTPARRRSVASRFEPMVGWLPGVWLAGSIATAGLLAAGLVGVDRLRRSSRRLEDGPIAGRCRELARSLGIAGRVGVAVCDRIAAPVLIGVVRPLILLPPAALGGWAVDQVEMALLHELAHLRRRDTLVNLGQRLVEALLFFHPVTWWLSAWIRLERELCCDRLVVERTGKPTDYARMLAGLAGSGRPAPSAASAMAGRPLVTRIRRILDMEDRSMKMTLPEGLALLFVATLGAALAVGAEAEAPRPEPAEAADAARRALLRMRDEVDALPDVGDDEDDARGAALLSIARALLGHGDREAALETLGRLEDRADPVLPPPSYSDAPGYWGRFANLVQSVEIRREAGDLDGARAALDRAARYVDGVDVGGAIERLDREIEHRIDEAPRGQRVIRDEDAMMFFEAGLTVIDQRAALGDLDEVRALIDRSVALLGPMPGPMNAVVRAHLGGLLAKAGDPAGGRALVDRALRDARALPPQVADEFPRPGIAAMLAEMGDLDGALNVIAELPPAGRETAFGELIEALATVEDRVAWLDVSGIKITIADPSLAPKDPASARLALPRIAGAIRSAGDSKMQARTLAIVAQLQARAGDFDAAIATAESIPDLKRSEYPGPSDGFYDAVKPATFAILAALRAGAGDAGRAAAAFDRAESLAGRVEAEDQRLIALIVLAQKLAEAGRPAASAAVAAGAVPLAASQPEPRRSRVLAMLATAQLAAGDPSGAERTAGAIREYPGLEKARALFALATWHDEAGDPAGAGDLTRQALACLEAEAPDAPPAGAVSTLTAFSRTTFVDFDLEFPEGIVRYHRDPMIRGGYARLGEAEAAAREIESLPPGPRHAAVSQLAHVLVNRGDFDGAAGLAASIDSPEARLRALGTIAATMARERSRK